MGLPDAVLAEWGGVTVETPPDPLEAICRALLTEIGENPDREGLRATPARFARAWREFIDYDPGQVGTHFEPVEVDQMVAVTGIRVSSVCEHHLLPFWADLTIAYITEVRVLGLSKFARIAHKHAHRLQLQERLVAGIADEVQHLTGSESVAVIARGEHSCMTTRGVRTAGLMVSSALRGAFKADPAARAELFSLSVRDGR